MSKSKAVSVYVLLGHARELVQLIDAARKQPGEVVKLDFNRVRQIAEQIKAMVS